MTRPALRLLCAATLLLSGLAHAADEAPHPASITTAVATASSPIEEVVTRHSLALAAGPLAYSAAAGTLALRNAKGDKEASIFYTAFTRDPAGPAAASDPAPRPVSILFNGGPGAGSAYLNIGAIGPRVLDFGDGRHPADASRLIDNPDTWLAFSDLVFIDPVGTGYSRATAQDDAPKTFWGVRQDLDALVRIIRQLLAARGQDSAPLYLVGESYGGFRVAALAQRLQQEGIRVTGLVMVSPVIDFATIGGGDLNLLPSAFRLAGYAATRMEASGPVDPALLEPVERFALGDYLSALAAIGPEAAGQRARAFAQVAEVTGLPADLVSRLGGRIPAGVFQREIQRSGQGIVSIYDGSVAAPDPFPESSYERIDDPILDGTRPAFAGGFHRYARDELGYRTDLAYEILNGEVSRRWDWKNFGDDAYVGATDQLRRALASNGQLRALIAHGYTDLVTPYLASRYLVGHMPKALAERVSLPRYPGGHMMYMRPDSRAALAADARALYLRTE